MNCTNIRPQLMDYAWQRLPAAEAGAVDIHLSDCVECRALLEQERSLGDAFGSVPIVAPRADIWDSVRIRRAALDTASAIRAPHPLITAPAAGATRRPFALALAAAVVTLVLMAAPTSRLYSPPGSGARTIAQTLDQAREVARQSDDPLGDITDSTWTVLSVSDGSVSPS